MNTNEHPTPGHQQSRSILTTSTGEKPAKTPVPSRISRHFTGKPGNTLGTVRTFQVNTKPLSDDFIKVSIWLRRPSGHFSEPNHAQTMVADSYVRHDEPEEQ